MAIPDYQSLMLPVLRLAGDGQEHRIGDVVLKLADEFKLTDAEREHMLPSGRQQTFNNRVHWAKSSLSQAGLLTSTRRAHFKLTDRGRDVLGENPQRIDVNFLMRFKEFQDFRTRERQDESDIPIINYVPARPIETAGEAVASAATPDELVRLTVKSIERTLAIQLIDRVLNAPPAFFEGLIVSLLLAMGYGGTRENAGRAIGKSGDGGIDGVIDQDPLGLGSVPILAIEFNVEV